MTTLLVFLAAAAFLAVVVPRYGVDTRDSRDWTPVEPFPPDCAVMPVTPVAPVTVAGRAGRAQAVRRAGAVRAPGPRSTIGVHRN
ncbi:hypothetical protein [Streptosporangium sp. NBC_01756]|uniref:hypothetical protein n=1 Tax=Streptosporangium sp. NBC_01756 TaxID=2975950 RepID=UPI002DDBF569|nr:hypothetical protein [Streptosporangium sp. NBC_01756]WSC86621.1 hypothetical protein OIE48_40835 [Streptosporangium sp. NBC_01756]